MHTLLLHHELYSLRALERTVEVYASAGQVGMHQEMLYFRVDVVAATPEAESELAGELANYALALTVEERRAATRTE